MDRTRWAQVQAIFHEAADLPSAEARRALVEARCAGDAALAGHVFAMLAADAQDDALLIDRGIGGVAHVVFGGGVQAGGRTDRHIDGHADRQPDSPARGQADDHHDGDRDDPLIGTRIGPYTLTRQLGEGGMGVVYLGVRDDLGSVAAIKLLRDARLSPARRERFASEQRMLAGLTHPSIARLYDADSLPDGTPWIAMEYVEGIALDEYCATHAPPLSERLRLFREVCEAVRYAHHHLVVHRDLKPSNILVTGAQAGSGGDGSGIGHVKLLDFGIAKQLERAGALVDQTRTVLRLMTPAYAAPEQVRGEPVGVHTDVYTLGVILYELLAGKRPFDLSSRTPREAETIVLEREPEKPSVAARSSAAASPGRPSPLASIGRAAWVDLDVLCLTAMRKETQRRYASADALIRDVDHFLRGEPLDARGDSLAYRAGKFARRHWRALAAACLVLIVMAGLIGFYTIRLASARDAALAETARTQRVQRFILNVFEAGESEEAPAAALRVVTLLDRGLQEARNLDREPAVQAELYDTLGTVYQRLGNHAQAEPLLQQALDRRRALHGADHPDVIDSLVTLGLLRVAQARLGDAERLVRDGYEKANASLPPEHPVRAKATAAWGKVLEGQGQHDRAIPILEEAVRLSTVPGPPTSERAAAMTTLANAHYWAGHLDQADAINREVIAISRRLRGDRHPSVGHDLINLGATQFERGKYKEAEGYRREALAIFQDWYGEQHPETASAQTLVAQALVSQRQFDEAAGLLRRALATQERTYGPTHPRVALVLNSLGSVSLQQNDYDGAEAAFVRTLEIYRKTYPDGRHTRVGVAQANLASVFLARKEYVRAEEIFRSAVASFTEVLGADHQQTGIAQIKLGRALERQGRDADAERFLVAGYRTLMKKVNPGVTWLQSAREDLANVYDALNQPEKAKTFRDEHATYAKSAGTLR